MSRIGWSPVTAIALVLALSTATPANAAKPQPPVTIVAVMAGSPFVRVVASDGTVYDVASNYPAPECGQALTRAVVVGHMFPGAPVSPISGAFQSGLGLVVTLENGDVWILNESCCTPGCYGTGTYMGNIFTVAASGNSASAQFSPELNLAPSGFAEPESPEPKLPLGK